MSLNLIVLILSLIAGVYSLLIGFDVFKSNKVNEHSPESAIKMRKAQKSIGFFMILIFALNLFKLVFMAES